MDLERFLPLRRGLRTPSERIRFKVSRVFALDGVFGGGVRGTGEVDLEFEDGLLRDGVVGVFGRGTNTVV